jgi:hypothetical protein
MTTPCSFEVRFREVGVREVGVAKIDLFEVGAGEHGRAEIRAAQGRLLEVRPYLFRVAGGPASVFEVP